MDNFLDNNACRPVFYEGSIANGQRSDHVSSLKAKELEWITIKNSRQLGRWEDTESNRNPFPGRSVKLKVNTASTDNFTIFMDDFLDCFGDNLYHVDWVTTGAQNSYAYFVRMFQQWTAKFGNLKSLKISGKITPEQNPRIPDKDYLKFFLLRNTYYQIPTLESLEISNFTGLREEFQQFLIKLFKGQLKRLKITETKVFNQDTFLKPGLPNLNELILNVNSLPPLEKMLKTCRTSPLVKLTLSISRNCAFWEDIEALFTLIGGFGNTLRYLRLDSKPTEGIIDVRYKPPELRTSHLQTLELEGFVNLSFQFLQGFTDSLEYLFLKNLTLGSNYWHYLRDDDKEFYDHVLEDRMYQHKIWQEMPKLKKIICENASAKRRNSPGPVAYTRAEAEALKKDVDVEIVAEPDPKP